MITQSEYIANEAKKADDQTILSIRRTTQSGIACDCGKELHWVTLCFYEGFPSRPGMECDCGKKGFFDRVNMEFVWVHIAASPRI